MRPLGRRARADASVVVHVQYPPAHMLSSGLWQLSHGLADLGLLLLLLVMLLMLLSGQWDLSDKLASVVPEPVRVYFQSEQMKAGAWEQARRPKPAEIVHREIVRHAAVSPRPAPARFGLGSTTDEVRAIQGPPTEAGENVWTYGPSEVYFVQGRVVSWHSDPRRPLRAR